MYLEALEYNNKRGEVELLDWYFIFSLSSLVERLPNMQDVAGPIPAERTIIKWSAYECRREDKDFG